MPTKSTVRSLIVPLLLSLILVAFVSGAGESGPVDVLRPDHQDGWDNEWYSVDLELSENLLVVGSSQAGANSPGTVHVYRRVDSSWVVEEVISHLGLSTTGFPANRRFGNDVAIADDEQTIFVGAPSDAGFEYGAVFLYRRGVDEAWVEVGKLLAPDGEDLDWFGGTVEVSGDNLAVAAYRTNDLGFDTGSVYMYRHQLSGEWRPAGKLTIPDARPSDLFGNILTIQGDLLVASSVTADLNDHSSQGAAYTFQWNAPKEAWEYQGRLAAFEGSPGDFFGSGLALSGDLLAVGAYGRGVPTREGLELARGSVYLYQREASNVSGWRFVSLINSEDGQAGDWFGRSVDFDGELLVVGAPSWTRIGAAYAFRRNSNGIVGNWRQVHKFTYDGATGRPLFGDDVVISPHAVVIAAREDRDISWKEGAAFLFDRNFDRQVPAHHYDQWRATHFSAAALLDPVQRMILWGDGADPDHDGIPNLAEYLRGLHPWQADPISARLAPVFDGESLTWSLPISPESGVRATAYVQSSSGLGAWERAAEVETSAGENSQTLRIDFPVDLGPVQFFRLGYESE